MRDGMTIILHLAQDLPSRPEAQSPLAGMLMSVGVLLLVLVTWFSLRKKLLARGTHERVNPKQLNLQAEQRSRGRLESVMVDAEELARRLAAHMDNKAARLEILLREADERIEELRGLTQSAGASPSSTPHPFDAQSVKDPRSRRILELAATGKSAMEISRELDEPIGTVELVMALRAQQPAEARGLRR
ncbi:MAG: hypothetical protein ACF8GE_03105 [Phycisphaerales bacterium JB043]